MKKPIPFILCIAPILNVYNFPGLGNVGAGAVIIIMLMLYIISNYYLFSSTKKFSVKIDYLLWFFLYLVIISLVNVVAFANSFSELIKLCLRLFQNICYILPVFLVTDVWGSYRRVVSIYLRICFILSLIIIVQSILHSLFGIDIYLFTSALDMHYADANAENVINSRTEYRPSAFFPEPAYYASYVIYAIPLLMFGKDFLQKKIVNINYSLYCYVIFAGVFLSTSFAGVMVLLLLICVYVATSLLKSRISIRSLYVILILPFIFIGMYYVSSVMIENIITRMGYFHLDADISLASSNDLRLLLGYLLYLDMDTVSQFLGAGCATLEEYFVSIHNIYVLTLGTVYTNGIGFVLCSTGIIGFCLFFKWLKYNWFASSLLGKVILVTFVIIQSYSDNIRSFTFAIFYGLLMASQEKGNENEG